MIYVMLFLNFLQIGTFSIGGGYAAISLIQNIAVDNNHWLTLSQFTDLVTIAEMTPGPIAVNAATFVGHRVAGIGGAIAATIGCVLPSCIIVSVFALLYRKYRHLPILQRILSSMRPVIVALIASAGMTILINVLFPEYHISFEYLNIFGVCIFLCAFFILRKFKVNPIIVILLCGLSGLILGVLCQLF